MTWNANQMLPAGMKYKPGWMNTLHDPGLRSGELLDVQDHEARVLVTSGTRTMIVRRRRLPRWIQP